MFDSVAAVRAIQIRPDDERSSVFLPLRRNRVDAAAGDNSQFY
jgi:hypothetical protein